MKNKRDNFYIKVRQTILEIPKDSFNNSDVKEMLKKHKIDIPAYYINTALENLIDLKLLIRDGFNFIKTNRLG